MLVTFAALIVIATAGVSGLLKHIVKSSCSWIKEEGRKVTGWEKFVSRFYYFIRRTFYVTRIVAIPALIVLVDQNYSSLM